MWNKIVGGLWLMLLSATLLAQTLQDPTRPGQAAGNNASQTRQASDYQLGAVFFSAQRQQAVVNNALVSVGDHIGGARVMAIAPDYVRLQVPSSQGPQLVTVKLESASVKRRTSEEF